MKTSHLRTLAFGVLLGILPSPVLAAPILEAAPATPSIAPDPHQLAALSQEDLQTGKLAELERPMTAARAARLLQEPETKVFYRTIGYMTAPKLRELARLEPTAPVRFAKVLAGEQKAWLQDMNQVLGTFGVRADGPVKSWYSMLGKLDRNTEENRLRGRLLADGSPVPATPGELNDLTRARVNLPKLDPALLHRMVEHVQATLPQKRPLCALNFVVKDYATDAILRDPAAPYKGRIHVIVEDVTDGIKRGAFELQLGPKHLTEYWDRHFKVAGSNQDFDLHDGVYKGVGALSLPRHLEKLGRGLNPGKVMAQGEAVTAGKQVVAEVLAEYQRQLESAVSQATAGTPELDYGATATLRARIGEVFHALAGETDLPEGLKQHQHAPL